MPFNVIIPVLFIIGSYPFFIIDAYLLARKTEAIELQSYNKWYFYILYPIIFLIVLAHTNFYVDKFEAIKVPSMGMANTIIVGDFFWADKKAYVDSSPLRGDIVIFYPPHIEIKYIKRCMAIPGDTLEIIDRVIFINGNKQDELGTVKFTSNRIKPRMAGGRNSFDNYGPIIIPENYFFMMGDNRDNSSDSRAWGLVSEESILGEVSTIYWSDDWNRIGMIPK